jgi:hypothetical protein
MRALGIPGNIEGYLQFPYGNGHHLWIFIPDSLGNTWEFSLNGYKPRAVKGKKLDMGRVFRRCFGIQAGSLPVILKGRRDLPPLLNNPFIRDVSARYMPDLSLTVEANRWTKKDDVLYLCTFGFENWVPVAWSIWRNGQFVFDHVEKDMIYLPAYYKDGVLIPAGPLCYINQYGIYTAFEPGKRRQDISVSRKYPLRGVWANYNKRIINGRFQVDHDSTFSNPVTLHTVKQESDMRWATVEVPDSVTYRYVRYLSGDNGNCNMAEVQVITENGRQLKGKVIGTTGSYLDKPNNRREAVFDGDPLTFFDANEFDGAWAGLDLGEPKAIKKINYVFRNDDNNIRLGDEYELLYWDDRWHSLGKWVAEKGVLEYKNVPVGVLLWLRNHTRGREERPFIYIDETQLFIGE